jgi:hypothetical protein
MNACPEFYPNGRPEIVVPVVRENYNGIVIIPLNRVEVEAYCKCPFCKKEYFAPFVQRPLIKDEYINAIRDELELMEGKPQIIKGATL